MKFENPYIVSVSNINSGPEIYGKGSKNLTDIYPSIGSTNVNAMAPFSSAFHSSVALI